jgi:hypothetical protein
MTSNRKDGPVFAIAAVAAIIAALTACNSGTPNNQYGNSGYTNGGYGSTGYGGGGGTNISGYYAGTNQAQQIQDGADANEGAGISADPGGDAGAGDGN